MKTFFLFLLLVTTLSLFGQAKISLSRKIVNKETGEPVPFASILSYSSETFGTTSNSDGYFNLISSDSLANSKIHISAIGYIEKIISYKELQSLSVVMLEPTVYQLDDVFVFGSRLEKFSIGSKSHDIRTFNSGYFGFGSPSPGWSNGVYVMPKKKYRNSIISSLEFFITDQGPLNSSFLLRILIPQNTIIANKMESMSTFYDHLDRHIVCKVKNLGWNSIELQDETIVLPSEPFILLFIPLDEGEKHFWINDANEQRYGSVIAFYNNKNVDQMNWVIFTDGKLSYQEIAPVPAIVINCLK
jgi:hypothetical protein